MYYRLDSPVREKLMEPVALCRQNREQMEYIGVKIGCFRNKNSLFIEFSRVTVQAGIVEGVVICRRNLTATEVVFVKILEFHIEHSGLQLIEA